MRIACILLIALFNVACRGNSDTRPDFASSSGFGPRLLVTADLRIDGMQADLVPIGGVAVMADGTIAILQPQDYIIRFFSAGGEPLGAIGGRGEGPGEFQDMIQLAWLADTLVVYDQELRRFTLMSPNREFVRTVLAPIAVRPDPPNAESLPEHAMLLPKRLYAEWFGLRWHFGYIGKRSHLGPRIP